MKSENVCDLSSFTVHCLTTLCHGTNARMENARPRARVYCFRWHLHPLRTCTHSISTETISQCFRNSVHKHYIYIICYYIKKEIGEQSTITTTWVSSKQYVMDTAADRVFADPSCVYLAVIDDEWKSSYSHHSPEIFYRSRQPPLCEVMSDGTLFDQRHR